MSEPTICVECKHDEPPERPKLFGGEHHCGVIIKQEDFINGGVKEIKVLCMMKNHGGHCLDFEAKA